jgi:hypothetical protein
MALKTQNADGRLTLNGIRHIRQYAVTGHHVQLADIAALVSQYLELDAEVTRLREVLGGVERTENERLYDAWIEGWTAGSDAVLRQFPMTAEERILALVTAQSFEENPYLARLSAPIVEDLPEGAEEVPCG